MKGILLAAGEGTRLFPITKITSKALIPVYNKPMIFYPLELLKKTGAKEVLIIVSSSNAGQIIKLLEDGSDFGLNLSYKIQKERKGMAHALALAEEFVGKESMAVATCDNIFEDKLDASNFKIGARVFLKKTPEAAKYIVAEISEEKIRGLEEKPKTPKSDYAVTGFYLFDNKVFNFIKKLNPSIRGELELAEIFNDYLKENKLDYRILNGFWCDTGLFDTLHLAAEFIKNKEKSI